MNSPWGIDNLNKDTAAKNKEQLQAMKEECSVYAAVFNTSEGHKVLEHFKKILNNPTWPVDSDTSYGYFREGQNDIIRHIINRVNKAKEF